jgi:membrane-associated protein
VPHLPNIEHFPYLGMFILLLLGGVGLPFPEDSTLILCGFLISTHNVKPIPAVITVYLGLLTADLMLHFIGRKYGRRIINQKRFQKWISPERISYLEEKFNHWGVLLILGGRHLAGLRVQIFLVSGVLKMSTIKFVLADAVSSLFTMGLMIGAGYMGGKSLEILKRDFSRIEHVGVILLVSALIVYLFYGYFKPKKKR